MLQDIYRALNSGEKFFALHNGYRVRVINVQPRKSSVFGSTEMRKTWIASVETNDGFSYPVNIEDLQKIN